MSIDWTNVDSSDFEQFKIELNRRLRAAFSKVNTGDAWNGDHTIMGTYHLWIDAAGKLRVKDGRPTSDTDGTKVGTQT